MRPGIVPSVWLRGVPRDVAHSFVHEETRQEYATARTQFYQQAVVADGGDKARQFLMLVNTFREFGQLYDRGYRLRDLTEGAA